jgi:hypothetical protein
MAKMAENKDHNIDPWRNKVIKRFNIHSERVEETDRWAARALLLESRVPISR